MKLASDADNATKIWPLNVTYTLTLQTVKAAGSSVSESTPSLHLFNVDVCVRCAAKCMYQIWCSNRLGAVSNYDQVISKLRGLGGNCGYFFLSYESIKLSFLSLREDANRRLTSWPLNKTYTLWQTAGSWARDTGHVKRYILLFLCHVC